MKYLLLFFSSLLLASFIYAQSKPAYVLYKKNGKKVSYKKMIRSIENKDVVLFGEYHNNAIAHWLELEVAKDLHQTRNLIMGAEMFEKDNQQQVDEYLQGKIDERGLDTMARLWPNYHTDYAPLLDFSKENKIEFVATNIPRRYASMVARGGFEVLDSLPASQKVWMAPLPVAYDANLPGYRKMLEMMPGHGGPNLPKAQAIKDATMANSILTHFKPGSLFIHYNGSYHSENYEGIVWYLRNKNPGLKIATITTVSQKDINKLEDDNKNKADFIICVDADMTNTY